MSQRPGHAPLSKTSPVSFNLSQRAEYDRPGNPLLPEQEFVLIRECLLDVY